MQNQKCPKSLYKIYPLFHLSPSTNVFVIVFAPPALYRVTIVVIGLGA